MERTITFGPLLNEVAAELVVEDGKTVTRHTVCMTVARAQVLMAQLKKALDSATAWNAPSLSELIS